MKTKYLELKFISAVIGVERRRDIPSSDVGTHFVLYHAVGDQSKNAIGTNSSREYQLD